MGPLQRVHLDDATVYPHRDRGPRGVASGPGTRILCPHIVSRRRDEAVPPTREEESQGMLVDGDR